MSNPFLNPKQNIDKKPFNENRGRRDNYNSNNRYNDNRFKTITPDKLDINNIKAFPTLVNTKKCDTMIQLTSNFKDILNIVIEDDSIEKTDIILPGWLQLTMFNGKVLKKEFEEEVEDEVEDEEQQQEELNYNMYKIGNALQTNYELYEKEYDSINGEGSYDTNFRLSPVYGSEYDSNSESEEKHDQNDEHEQNDEN